MLRLFKRKERKSPKARSTQARDNSKTFVSAYAQGEGDTGTFYITFHNGTHNEQAVSFFGKRAALKLLKGKQVQAMDGHQYKLKQFLGADTQTIRTNWGLLN